MGVSVLRDKKNLAVRWYGVGKVKDFKLAYFSPGQGMRYLEPGFAVAVACAGEVIEGLAFAISPEDAASLDQQEMGYDVTMVDVELFAGGKVRAGIYTRQSASEDALPSLRYNRLMLAGALEAGLSPAYVERLRVSYYVTAPEVRAQTLALVEQGPKDRWFTAQELSKYVSEDVGWATSVMGFVVVRKLVQMIGLPSS